MADAKEKKGRQGIALEKSFVAKLDKKRVPTTKKAEEQEVSGQFRYTDTVWCPYCGKPGVANFLQTEYYVLVDCWYCHATFMA